MSLCGGRFETLSKQPAWDLQSRLEHVAEEVLASPAYLDTVLKILDAIAGEKDASEKRRVVRAALFDGARKRDETLSQFAARREQELAGAGRYLTIPSEETSGLFRQGTQNLRTLTGGSVDYDRVLNSLKMLDVEEEPLTKGKASLFTGITEDESDDGSSSPSRFTRTRSSASWRRWMTSTRTR